MTTKTNDNNDNDDTNNEIDLLNDQIQQCIKAHIN